MTRPALSRSRDRSALIDLLARAAAALDPELRRLIVTETSIGREVIDRVEIAARKCGSRG